MLAKARYRVLRSGEKSVVAKIFALHRYCDTIVRAVPAVRVVFCLVFSLSLLSCNSTRPVVKIGLLAPFEGLYRESGYQALSAMRAALADYPLREFEVVPLALDTSADPGYARRAAAKMLRDDSVVAVVGPLQARQVSAVADVISTSGVDWWPQSRPPSTEAARNQVEAIIALMPGTKIAVAGQDFGWPQTSAAELSSKTGKSVTIVDAAPDAAADGAAADGLLWLGSAEEGTAFLSRLRKQGSTVPFWTTAVAGDPVFHSLLMERLDGAPPGPIYWAIALNEVGEHYKDWASAHEDAAPNAYTVYLATQRALQQIAGDVLHSNERVLAVLNLDLAGNSELIEIVQIP